MIRTTLLVWLLIGGLSGPTPAWGQAPGAAGEVAAAVSPGLASALETDPRVARLRIPPGRERLARRLLADVGFLQPLAGGWHFDAIAIEHRQLVLEIRRVGEASDATPAARVHLDPKAVAGPGERVSESFVIRPQIQSEDPQVRAHVEAAIKSVIAHDEGGFFEETPGADVEAIRSPVELPAGLEDRISDDWRLFHRWPHSEKLIALDHLGYAGLALLAWLLALAPAIIRRRGDYSIVKRVRATHLLPTGIQLIVFAYWALYWDAVPVQLQLIGLQVIFAYGFDALLGLTLEKKWTISYGPIPIALSANLFVWFPGDHFYLSVVVIALALASKALIRRDGRHIFNPSALGIAIVGGLCISMPTVFPYIDIAHQLNLPPNMLELIFLLALLPQIRIPIIPVTFGAMLITYVLTASHPMLLPGPFWPAVFLAFVLLATDPATIPRTGGGRVLFGLVLGLVTVVVSSTLEYNGISDFYGKVLAIPVANLLVPNFDRLAKRYGQGAERWLGPERNRLHVAIWAVVILAHSGNGTAKEGAFEAVWHRQIATPHVVERGGGVTCDDNPVWCVPFSFVQEWQMWFPNEGEAEK